MFEIERLIPFLSSWTERLAVSDERLPYPDWILRNEEIPNFLKAELLGKKSQRMAIFIDCCTHVSTITGFVAEVKFFGKGNSQLTAVWLFFGFRGNYTHLVKSN